MFWGQLFYVATWKPQLKSSPKTVDFDILGDGVQNPWVEIKKPRSNGISNGCLFHAW